MKRCICLLLAMLLCAVSLCGCGKGVIDAPSYTAPSAEELCGTYWVAVQLEGEGVENSSVEMPSGGWNVDLFLNADGTGRFRNTYGASYVSFQPECTWVYDGSGKLEIITADGSESFKGEFINDRLCVEYYGDRLWLEKAAKPAAGGEFCLADLEGAWALDSIEIEGYVASADEEGLYGSVCFFSFAPTLIANYTQSDDFGNRTEFVDAPVVYLDEPLYYGCANEAWSVELITGDDSLRCYAALTDRETLVLLLEVYFAEDEYPAVSTQIFRWEGTGAVG